MTDNLVGIIGWPVSHSISPVMHNRALVELGLTSWRYLALPVPNSPARVKEAVLGLRALGFRGANVTIPHKEAVVPHLDKLSDEARAIGAVNTIVVDEAGLLVGHNTDGRGFIAHLHEHGLAVGDLSVVLLGAGGSARAIAYGLLQDGCKNITILNRTVAKAAAISSSFAASFPGATLSVGVPDKPSISHASRADIVINATSIGMAATKDQMPWDDGVPFRRGQVVYDLIYNPRHTRLLRHGEAGGAHIINGLGMLVHQGALAFELWTGRAAPLAIMRDAADEAMKKALATL